MRYLIAALVLASLAIPVGAHPRAGFPFNLTFASDGTITGTFGGVPVTGTYSASTFTLMVDGQVFASGTYTCNGGGCTFTGDTLLGVSKPFTFTSTSLPTSASGRLTGLFSTHGAWVSGVAKWAKANLTTMRVGQIVRAAASIQGKSASAQSESANSKAARERGERGKGHNK